jgi:hypothetical protein
MIERLGTRGLGSFQPPGDAHILVRNVFRPVAYIDR